LRALLAQANWRCISFDASCLFELVGVTKNRVLRLLCVERRASCLLRDV
jgi:hypothetical protein